MQAKICRAKDQSACRYHGSQLSNEYKGFVDEYNKTGTLPKVLFMNTTVEAQVDTAELIEYESFHEMNIQSYGFPKDPDENFDGSVYVETPLYDSPEEELAAVAALRDNETDLRMKARYATIHRTLADKNADAQLLKLQEQGRSESDELIRSSSYETTIGDAHIIRKYGEVVDARKDLTDGEKAIVLWESLRKNQGYDQIDNGIFGDKAYENIVKDTWNVYALAKEQRERRTVAA